MLVPQHPRPVARRREVAELTVSARQAATIAPGHVVPAAPGTAVPPRAAIPVRRPEAPADDTIRITVVYRLREYLAILREFMPTQMLQRERSRGQLGGRGLSWSARLALAVLVPLVGAPAFWLKKRRMPVCRFTIAASGIAREAGGGRLQAAWSEVVAVHRLDRAWLVALADGAMPLPYRCFSAAQRAGFERLVALHVDRPDDIVA